ncbi:MAG: hypothetical protein GXP62_14100 [Oligoflexia bacterium]|nr:hypothetical protein [Oligoflexia bacterium]
MTRPALLTTLLFGLSSSVWAANPAAEGLSRACASDQVDACLALARAQTGVGLPVDLLAARTSYDHACTLKSAEGCKGAQGIARYLGRHVALSFLSSVPRVWAVSGPARVLGPDQVTPAAAAVTQAILADLPFAEACYGTGLQDNAQIAGTLDLSLVVDDGAVTQVDLLQAELGDVDVARCIADAVGDAVLPADTAQGEIFVRLRAEPGPAASAHPPVVQDHLADGAQITIGDPTSKDADRRVEIALTVAVRRALGGTNCVLDELQAGRWAPVILQVSTTIPPDGNVRGLRVSPQPQDRSQLADCVGQQLQSLQIGMTGMDKDLGAQLVVRVAPAWTATLVP